MIAKTIDIRLMPQHEASATIIMRITATTITAATIIQGMLMGVRLALPGAIPTTW